MQTQCSIAGCQADGFPALTQPPSSSSTTSEEASQPGPPVVADSELHSNRQQHSGPSSHIPSSSELQAAHQQPRAGPLPSGVILVSRYLTLCQSTMSTESGFRIFCAVLALLQPSHAQGVPVQTIRPSQLLLHRSGHVTTQRELPLSVREAELYASPEELTTGCSSPASDMFSLGVLFFELLNPIQDAQQRSRVLTEVRRRALPASLGQHRPHETAFLLALLHPEPSKRPTVAQIIGSNLLNMLRSSLHQHPSTQPGAPALHQQQMLAQQQRLKEEQHRRQQQLSKQGAGMQPQQQKQAFPLEGVNSETLLDFLKIMRQTSATALKKTQHQLTFLNSDIQEVNSAMLALQCQYGSVGEQLPGELLQQSSAPEQLLLQPKPQAPLELQHPASRKRQRSWEADTAECSSSVTGSLESFPLATLSQADCKRERIQQSCQNVDRAFGELERKFFLQREMPNRQANRGSSDLSDSSQTDLPGLAGLSDHLADFSADLVDFSRYSHLKVPTTVGLLHFAFYSHVWASECL